MTSELGKDSKDPITNNRDLLISSLSYLALFSLYLLLLGLVLNRKLPQNDLGLHIALNIGLIQLFPHNIAVFLSRLMYLLFYRYKRKFHYYATQSLDIIAIISLLYVIYHLINSPRYNLFEINRLILGPLVFFASYLLYLIWRKQRLLLSLQDPKKELTEAISQEDQKLASKDKKLCHKNQWPLDSQIAYLSYLKERTQAVIYGLIIGDALGVPVESKKRGSYRITDMVGYGTYNQPPGTWSDDSSLTLALMEHLSEDSSLEKLMDKFVAYRQGGLSSYGQCFDIDLACKQAIDRYLAGSPIEQAGSSSEGDNGNGALMRISPLSLSLLEEFDYTKRVLVIEKYTQITHRHPRSVVASLLYIQLLIGMHLNNSFHASLESSKDLLLNEFPKGHPYREEFEDCYQEMFTDSFFDKAESEITSSGHVVDTLSAAIWCVGTSGTYQEAVLKAVNLGGDTDTTAAITGSIAGAHYKIQNIPDHWIQQLANKPLIDKRIEDFYQAISGLVYNVSELSQIKERQAQQGGGVDNRQYH